MILEERRFRPSRALFDDNWRSVYPHAFPSDAKSAIIGAYGLQRHHDSVQGHR